MNTLKIGDMVHRVDHPLWLGQVMHVTGLANPNTRVALITIVYEVYWLAHGGSWHISEELEAV